jgi:hypothetical protein
LAGADTLNNEHPATPRHIPQLHRFESLKPASPPPTFFGIRSLFMKYLYKCWFSCPPMSIYMVKNHFGVLLVLSYDGLFMIHKGNMAFV